MDSICRNCRKIPLELFTMYDSQAHMAGKGADVLPSPPQFRHHPSRASLIAAADKGCPLCRLVRRVDALLPPRMAIPDDGPIDLVASDPFQPEVLMLRGYAGGRMRFTPVPESWSELNLLLRRVKV